MKSKIFFVTSNDSTPWGGSEVLWVNLVEHFSLLGFDVAFSIKKWGALPLQIRKIASSSKMFERDFHVSLLDRIKFRFFDANKGYNIFESRFVKSLSDFNPGLVVIAQGGNQDGLFWIEHCYQNDIPFITISQAASETHWPSDKVSKRMSDVMPKALANLFVSHDNKRLTENQIGNKLENGKVISNPYNVPFENEFPFPESQDGVCNLACVARLELQAKGQDVIFEVLSDPKWRGRNIKLNLYGKGIHTQNIERLIKMFDLTSVEIQGYADTTEIWKTNQALILPSRYEGLPLALVEAMLCGRFGIVTDVSGNAEVIRDNINGFVAAAPRAAYLDEAMERAWQRRSEWEEIGLNAKSYIKTLVPQDPVKVVADHIISLISK